MSVDWLHISDFHIKSGDPYDRDVVLGALVRSVGDFRKQGRRPDLIFATGDIANSGKAAEYAAATPFFDAICAAAGIEKRRLFVIPGNHDVDRDLGFGLARTLGSREDSDRYFRPGTPKPHHFAKLREFVKWHDGYFAGIRTYSETSSCCEPELVEIDGRRIGVLSINTALFCEDDNDYAKLWVGRRCLDDALPKLATLKADLKIALVHHPLDWLHDAERANITASLQDGVDLILRGHLHETNVQQVAGVAGAALHVAAGAAYQGSKYPNRALYARFHGADVEVFPLRYDDSNLPIWTVDTGVFPRDPDFTRAFAISRLVPTVVVTPPPVAPRPPIRPSGLSTIPSRSLPFFGRDKLLAEIETRLGDPATEAVVVLHGQAGVGKSELAREFARRRRAAYPGGTFVVEADGQALAVNLARLGQVVLRLRFPEGMGFGDQSITTMIALAAAPTLLIYDNVQSVKAVEPWMPRVGAPQHVLMTTTLDQWDAGWRALLVEPLTRDASLQLIAGIAASAGTAGTEASDRYGGKLAERAGGLPVQLVPASVTLAHQARRGRGADAALATTAEAQGSFGSVYRLLGPKPQLLLQAAARFDPLRIPRDELQKGLADAAGWTENEFLAHLDACLDLHVIENGPEMRMHQLFSGFVLTMPEPPDLAETAKKIVRALGAQMAAIAREVDSQPGDAKLTAKLLAFVPEFKRWSEIEGAITTEEGEVVGRALSEIGQFSAALPWCERAVAAKQKGDANGRIDSHSLGASLHQVGYCLSSAGDYVGARSWFERAVSAQETGDANGLVDHESLGKSVDAVGYCLGSVGDFAGARAWHERAVAEAERGDAYGRVDRASLGASLHQVGYCLSSAGDYAGARSWFERAAAAQENGDVNGRVDHESLGKSLHRVGYCLSSAGDHAGARSWYERAVAEKEKGDVHGRVDYESLGRSVHRVGTCFSSAGDDAVARPWLERAVAAKEKGDVHGRVDQASVTISRNALARLRK